MKKYKMGEVVDEISVRVNDPASCGRDRFVGLEHYEPGEMEIKNYGSTDKLGSAMKLFEAGDILVARRNVYLRRAGIVHFSGITSGDSIVLRAKTDIFQRVLPFILNTDSFWDFADQYSDGTMSKRLSPKLLLSYEFTLPEGEKLEKMVDTLWAVYNAKDAYEELDTTLSALINGRYIEMFGDPFSNPMGWPVKKFDEFAAIDAIMTTDYEKYADYPHIGIDSIEKNTGRLVGYRTVKEDNVISGKYVFTPQHIIYSKIRPALNKVALPDFEGLCSADAYPILPNEENCNKVFLATVMRSKFFLSYILAFSSRSQMPKVNRKQITGFELPLPPKDLQDEFEEFVNSIEKAKEKANGCIEDAKALMKGICSEMMSE